MSISIAEGQANTELRELIEALGLEEEDVIDRLGDAYEDLYA